MAHEIQTFQQREAERTQLKNSMNEERSRWLLKLKESVDGHKYTGNDGCAG